jgi:hypothetical protein
LAKDKSANLPFLSSAWREAAHCPARVAVQRLDAPEAWLDSPEPAAPPEVSHLFFQPLHQTVPS